MAGKFQELPLFYDLVQEIHISMAKSSRFQTFL